MIRNAGFFMLQMIPGCGTVLYTAFNPEYDIEKRVEVGDNIIIYIPVDGGIVYPV